MINATFTTTWREWQSDGVPDWKLGDLEHVTENEKHAAKALTEQALRGLSLDTDGYDREYEVAVLIKDGAASFAAKAAS